MTRAALGLLWIAVGCSGPGESHGATAKEYGGAIPVVFINATPERLCGLYISFDHEPDYGDNWLPVGGLSVGKSLELKIKPGTYKAKWNTCKDARDRPTISYAATLVGGTAINISEPVQLYAFVSDGVPPTKRGVPRPKLKMIKFIGQTTEIAAAPPEPQTQPEAPPAEAPPEPTPPTASPPTARRSSGPFPVKVWAPLASARAPAPPPVPAPAPPPPPPPPAPAPPPPPPAATPPPPALGPPGSTLFSPKK